MDNISYENPELFPKRTTSVWKTNVKGEKVEYKMALKPLKIPDFTPVVEYMRENVHLNDKTLEKIRILIESISYRHQMNKYKRSPSPKNTPSLPVVVARPTAKV